MKRYTIGRSDRNDIVVANQTVSRRHAELEDIGSGRYLLKDLESTFGTRILRDGEWLEILEVEVEPKTEVQLGEFESTIGTLVADAEVTGEDSPRSGTRAKAGPTGGTPAQGFGSTENLKWIVLGGIGFVAVVAIGIMLGLFFRGTGPAPGSRSELASDGLRARLTRSCMGSRDATPGLCACRVKVLYRMLDRKELEIVLDMLVKRDGATLIKGLRPDEQRRVAKRIAKARRQLGAECRRG